MASRRVLIDVEEFNRRRGVAALMRGDSLDLEEVPPRPNAALVAGVVIALLLCGGSVATAYLTGRAPDGWRSDGSLVIDRETGARFMAEDGQLRPSPTLTSALLAGASRDPLLVPHDVLADAPVGPALPGGDLPERPPQLPATATGFTACTDPEGVVGVHAGAPSAVPAQEQGLLVAAPGGGATLVTGRSAHPLSDAALVELGYSGAQVRSVPAAWLALVPAGQELDQLPVPPAGEGRGVDEVGEAGDVVAAETSGRHFLVGDGDVAPLVNRTSELLAPAPARSVPDAVLLGAPQAPPVGLVDAPSEPPDVPVREAVVTACVRSSDALVSVNESVDDAATRPSPVRDVETPSGPVTAVWHFPPGIGALVGPTTLDTPREAGDDDGGGIEVVDAGVGYPVADLPVLGALGYERQQTVLLPDPWLALLAPGGVLASEG